MTNIIARSIAVTVIVLFVGFGAVGTPVGAVGGRGPRALPISGLPDVLKRAAIATRSDSSGQIAGAQIGGTGVYVVYIKTGKGCGSSGCRAQIWKRDGGRFVQNGSMPVGNLPIVLLPQTAHGMPSLGVTVFDKDRTGRGVLPVGFDGASYTQWDYGHLMPLDSGRALLTQAMMRPF